MLYKTKKMLDNFVFAYFLLAEPANQKPPLYKMIDLIQVIEEHFRRKKIEI